MFLVVLVAWPSLAAAKPTRVVIAKIQGDDDNSVGAAIKASIKEDVTVVPKKEATAAEEKLKLSEELTDKEVRKLLKAVDADVVIKGSLDTGDSMALHLKIYLRTGTKPKAFTLSFKDPASDKFRSTLRKTILAKLGIDEAPPPAADDAGDDSTPPPPVKPKKPKAPPPPDAGDDAQADDTPPPVKPKKPKKPPVADDTATPPPPAGDDAGSDDDAAPPVKPKKPKKPKKPVADDDDGDAGAGSDAPAAGSDEAAPAPTGRFANRDAVRVGLGPSVTARKLTFASRDYPQAPKEYRNGAVPGVRVDGEVYPLALSNPYGAAAGLGLAFDYDKTLSLTLKSLADDGTVVTGKAKEAVWSVGPRYRLVIGHKPTSPSITLGVSYGSREFEVEGLTLETRPVIDIPDVKYKAFQPGLTFRVPLAPSIALTLDARALLMTSAGQIALTSQYGQAKVTGGEATAGIDIVVSKHVAISLIGTFAEIGFAFVGNGAESNDRDGDPTSKDVGGAADRYIGGAVTVSVLY